MPEYTRSLIDRIHIENDAKLNSIGRDRTALSGNWLETHPQGRDRLRRYIYSYFNYRTRGESTRENRLWTTFKKHRHHLLGAGYARNFLVLNKKASNEYVNARYLVYAANIFMNPTFVNFYRRFGIEVNVEAYALSTMIQWIWRSAIRNGEDIWVYIPSKRMRDLFKAWLHDVSRLAERSTGGDVGGAA